MAMCIFQNCSSVQKPCCSLAFFSLPKDYRRQLWIENSGNSDLTNLSETARRVVCQKHFSPSSLRIQFHRTTLSRDAVPERWDREILNSSLDSPSVEPIEISEVDTCYDDDEYADENEYVHHSEDEAEVVELLEIDEEHSQAEEYTIDNMLHNEIDQQTNDEDIIILEEPPDAPTILRDDDRIEKPNVRMNKAAVICVDAAVASIKMPKQTNTFPDELMDHSDSVRHNSTSSDIIVSSSTSSKSNENPSASVNNVTNEEDKYFALALAGILQRISPQKKAFAKVNILRYLTELEFGEEARLN